MRAPTAPIALLCGLLAAVAAPAQAQTTDPMVTTLSGFHTPRLSLAWQLGMSRTIGPLVADSILVLRQIGAVAVGLTADYSLTRRLGVEAAVAWSPSTVAKTDWQVTVDHSAAVWLGSVRTRLLVAASPHYALTVASGVGFIDRRGYAWQGYVGMRQAALIAGANLWFRTSGQFSYGLELQDYVSRARYHDPLGIQFTPRLHNDALVTFSVRYAVIPL